MASNYDKKRKIEEGLWSKLPIDILELIAKKLALIKDYIRFRAVCRSWRSAAVPANLRPQPPHLLLPYNGVVHARPLFSLSTRSIRLLFLPEVNGQSILASSHGWLLMLRDSTISLFHPVTSVQIRLPPPTDFYRPGSPTIGSGRKNNIFNFIWNAFLFLNPRSAARDWVVIIMVHNWSSWQRYVHYCRQGDEVWTELKTNSPAPLDSVLYDEGRFYVLDINGLVTAYAAATSTALFSVPAPTAAAKFLLAKASETELLLLARDSAFLRLNNDVVKDCKLFKLDLSGQLLQWSEIDSIGDMALFAAEDYCLMTCSRGFPGCREDYIYFEASIDIFKRLNSRRHDIEVLNIKNGKYEVLRCEWDEPSTDLMKPIWFTPSLC